MRYTRYNYKKKNNNFWKLLVILIVFLVISVAASKGLSGLLKKGMTDNTKGEATDVNGGKAEEVSSGITLWIIQGGYYSKKENAEAVNNQLKGKYNSFIVQDGDKFRVIIDIIRKEQGDAFVKSLTEQGISFVKSEAVVDYKDNSLKQLGSSIDALMQHYEKLKESDVVAIKTEDIKKWSSEIKVPEGESLGKEELASINKFILELPEELTKDSMGNIATFIYNISVKFKR